jgi:polynucleotide 5'-kinase involved in rRNA processing
MNKITQYRILNSLAFNEMHRRFDSMGKANHETFEWILDEDLERQKSEEMEPEEALPKEDTKTSEKRALFRRWLQSGTDISHIAGKLGSGKSTLTKFLCNDRRSANLLETWAAGRQIGP